MCMCMCIHIYIYIYVHTYIKEKTGEKDRKTAKKAPEKGETGSALINH